MSKAHAPPVDEHHETGVRRPITERERVRLMYRPLLGEGVSQAVGRTSGEKVIWDVGRRRGDAGDVLVVYDSGVDASCPPSPVVAWETDTEIPEMGNLADPDVVEAWVQGGHHSN